MLLSSLLTVVFVVMPPFALVLGHVVAVSFSWICHDFALVLGS